MARLRVSFAAASAPPAAPERAAAGRRAIADGAGRARRALSAPGGRTWLASLGLGLALAAVAFGAEGGSELSRTTAVEVALLLAGGIASAAAIAFGPERRVFGATALALFAAFAALVVVSTTWSVAPELTWFEAGKTLAYLATFAAAMAGARLAPSSWEVPLKGILIAAAVVTGYALLSRILPADLAPNELYARIGKPFNYWNAVGVTAALAVPPALWLAARRSGHPPANALAYPLLGIFFVALFLSYSRGALAAAALGAALWFAFVPLRLRSLAALVTASAGAAPVILWALSKDAFTVDGVPLAAKEAVGAEFGLLVGAMVLALLAAGLAVGFLGARRAPSARIRRRVGVVAVGMACALPLAGIGALAASDGGIGGKIDDLTSSSADISGGPDRLTQAGSSRGRYWREAADVFADHKVAGSGANTFAVARNRYRENVLVARHAHGFVAQTAADLGILGLLATFALAGAWLVAAARTVGARRGGHRLPFDPERVGVIALALAALVYGLQAAIDWTWAVPGPTVMALIAAGFVAGRGPLPAVAAAPAEPPAQPARVRTIRGVPLPPTPRLIAAGLVLVIAGSAAWAAWQPERSDDASNEALALLGRGELGDAARKAKDAEELNPLSPKPLFVQASILQRAGDVPGAARVLERAVREHPSEPEVWLRLATFQLRVLDRPDEALHTLRGALYLDPRSRAGQSAFFEARERLRQQRAAAAQS